MAQIHPFKPHRYAASAGRLEDLVTQPYDKIYPAMRARYLAASPYNLVRVILGEKLESDTESDNVYTRSARYFQEWISGGQLEQDSEPGLFAYFQEFADPDSGERVVRKGFIGLSDVVEYAEKIVHRHEQTLSGPKKDRMKVLSSTGAHFGQIFMLYPDREGAVDRLLDEAAAGEPTSRVTDEYNCVHTLWKIADPGKITAIQGLMADKKLLIADGHHRYETALAFRDAHPELDGAKRVMMTFVNMYSPGLRILATHRLVGGLADFHADAFLAKAAGEFQVTPLSSLDALKAKWVEDHAGKTRIGVAIAGRAELYLLECAKPAGSLDVRVLHETILAGLMGISAEAVREEKHLHYVRGVEAAAREVWEGGSAIGFLLEPTSIEETAEVSFGGGVMPQKSTDFYPKLLTGLTIYKVC